MSITLNPPDGPWTVQDLAPQADYRIEVREGNLLIMPPATLWHSQVARRMANALESMGLPAVTAVGIMRSPRSTRVADVAIFHTAEADLHQAFWPPGEIATVVEVVADSSEEDDRIAKPHWYASAGIPEFWRAERSEVDGDAVVFQHQLARTADGQSAYVQSGVTTLTALESEAHTPDEG